MNEESLNAAPIIPGPLDALDKQRPDEPRFVLLGRDPSAPAAVLFWVDARRKIALQIEDTPTARAELIQCSEAEMVAHDMRCWRLNQPAEDNVTTARASYSGAAPDEAMKAKVARHAIIKTGLADLREAAYRVNEALSNLGDLGMLEVEQRIDLDLAKQAINRIADSVSAR